ncbi:MAG: alpha/beta hydrolase, partial [Calditrichaceae bacterium]
MEYFESGHLRVAYVDTGSGTPVMLLHCSSASHKEWNKLTEHLVKNYRVAAPDLIGYGESERLNNMNFDPYADVNMIINLANILNEPFHMVGHSYGGAMAL